MNLSIKEKIYGALFGYAIGDALGLGTEFMTRGEAGRRYPGGLRDYSKIIRDVHRSMWRRGEWTNDTEEVLAVTESICACGRPDCNDFAHRLHEFYCRRPDDMPAHMRWLFNDRNYLDDPVETAKSVWHKMKNLDASNECLGREVIIGLWSDNLRENALRFCQLTHPHPRCECSALLVATMTNSLMWHDRPADLGTLLSIANDIDPATLEFVEMAHDGKLSEMNLDDPSTLWYVRKAMGSALWELFHCDSPEEGLYMLVDAAGDADTNAALGTALLGLKYGYSALPGALVENLLGRERVEAAADSLCRLLTEKFSPIS